MRKILLSTIALSFCAGSAFADIIDIYDTVTGQTISSGTTALIHSGATLSDSIVDGGYVAFSETNASATGLTITNSGSLKASNANANFSDSYIDNGGKATLSNSFTAEDITVGNGGLFQASGTTGVVENLIIQQGGAYSLSTNLASVTATIQDNDDPDKKHYATISGKVAENFYIGENSKLQVTSDSTANNTIVNGGTLEGSSSKSNLVGVNVLSGKVSSKGSLSNATVNGGEVSQSGGTINDITVNSGGSLTATNADITNFAANSGSIINVDNSSQITGEFSLGKDADLTASTYDFSALTSNAAITGFTVSGGVNSVFNGDLTNLDTSQDKSLTFKDGEFAVSGSTSGVVDGVEVTKAAYWDTVNVENSTLALDDELLFSGYNQVLNIDEHSTVGLTQGNIGATVYGNVNNLGTIDLTTNDNIAEFEITGNYTAGENAQLKLKVDPDAGAADTLNVGGDVVGQTKLFLKLLSEGQSQDNIKLVEAPNNTSGNKDSFSIGYVSASPFEWEATYENNTWYAHSLAENPDGPVLRPETVAYTGLLDAAFWQTGGFTQNLKETIPLNSVKKGVCSKYNDGYTRGERCSKRYPYNTAWISPVYKKAKIDVPVVYEAEVTGVDTGFDLVTNGYLKFGIMGSIRKGKYTFDENGDDYIIQNAAEVDMDSYLAGAYWRFDKNNISVVSSIYGGLLKADITSDDNINSDTEGLEIGANLDVSYIYEVVKNITIEPNLRADYSILKMDDLRDDADNFTEFETANRLELEAGVKLAAKFTPSKESALNIFVKPSIVQQINDGETVNISNAYTANALEDRTLYRISSGLDVKFNSLWSLNGNVVYTFNSDYEDFGGTLNLWRRF